MRLLVVIDRYPPLHQGGDETACYTFVEGLRRRGHDVQVLTSEFGLDKPRVDDGRIYRVLHRPWYNPRLLDQARFEIADHRSLQQRLAAFRPDLILSWAQTSLFGSLHVALKEAGPPVVYFMGNIWIHWHIDQENQRVSVWERPGSSIANRLTKPLVRRAVRLLNRRALRPLHASQIDLRHAVQCSAASLRRHHDAGFQGDDWTVIYNPVDTERFHPGPGRAVGAPLAVLFAGRLVVEKGPHTLVEAAARLGTSGDRDVRTTIVGERAYPVEYSDALKARVAELGLAPRVTFGDAASYEEMPDLLRRHQVLVFPSNIPEGFPMMLVEAMACGLAVVGTTTGGSAEILKDGENSLTFPPDDADALARCLVRLRDDEPLRQRLAGAGQDWARRHCALDVVLDQLETYLRHVMETRER